MAKRIRRLKQTRVRSFWIKKRNVAKDNEGVPVITFGEPVEVKGEVWPATSKRQIETYGDRINDIANIHIQGQYTIAEQNGAVVAVLADDITLELGDGFYIFRDKDEPTPDYIILSITEYQPLKLEVERYHG
jgi:hypothetical protein